MATGRRVTRSTIRIMEILDAEGMPTAVMIKLEPARGRASSGRGRSMTVVGGCPDGPIFDGAARALAKWIMDPLF